LVTASARKKAVKSPRKQGGASSRRWESDVLSRDEINGAKRLALIRTAGRAFKEKGFHQTSLDDIAASLNVTKPTLYYHVNGKQDLLFQCHSHALDLGDTALRYGQDGVTGLEKLQRTLEKYIELINDQFYSYSLLSDLNDLTEEHRHTIQTRRRRFDKVFRDMVSAGIADKTIRSIDPKMAVFWFMGAINKIPQWFSENGAYTGADVARMYVDLITHGLAQKAR
jgi:AcrR family transcriptional regulator